MCVTALKTCENAMLVISGDMLLITQENGSCSWLHVTVCLDIQLPFKEQNVERKKTEKNACVVEDVSKLVQIMS